MDVPFCFDRARYPSLWHVTVTRHCYASLRACAIHAGRADYSRGDDEAP